MDGRGWWLSFPLDALAMNLLGSLMATGLGRERWSPGNILGMDRRPRKFPRWKPSSTNVSTGHVCGLHILMLLIGFQRTLPKPWSGPTTKVSPHDLGPREASSSLPITHCRVSSREKSFLTPSPEISLLLPPQHPPVISAPVNTHTLVRKLACKREKSLKVAGVLKSCQNPSALSLGLSWPSEPGLTPDPARLVPAAGL